jgi:hypothetical protein
MTAISAPVSAGTNSPAQGLNSEELLRRSDAGRKKDNEIRACNGSPIDLILIYRCDQNTDLPTQTIRSVLQF